MSKETPILFSTPMIQSIRRGDKTQTRRIMKPQPIHDTKYLGDYKMQKQKGLFCSILHPSFAGKYCIGDVLAVRETFYAWGEWEQYRDTKTGKMAWTFLDRTQIDLRRYQYVADKPDFNQDLHGSLAETRTDLGWHKRPSIFMPKAACRIKLKITNVRVERLQDISKLDAKAEGLGMISKDGETWKFGIPDSDGLPGTDDSGWAWQDWELTAKDAFAKLWQKINGEESWTQNPWVWVIEFEVMK
jgi:hypothetical protein